MITSDILIVGGGLFGAALARDAAMRGYKVTLLEKNDFGLSASFADRTLISWDILNNPKPDFDAKQMHEELEYLKITAPYLLQDIPYYYLRESLSDLSLGQRGKSWLNRITYRNLFPAEKVEVSGLRKSFEDWQPETESLELYEQVVLSSQRLAMALMLSAQKYGVQFKNYCRVQQILTEHSAVTGVVAWNKQTEQREIYKAKTVMLCAGAENRSLLGDISIFPHVKVIKRIHTLLAQPATAGLRIDFSSGQYLELHPLDQNIQLTKCMGQTWQSGAAVKVNRDEVQDVLQHWGSYLSSLHNQSPYYAWADLVVDASQKFIDHEHEDGVVGLISVWAGANIEHRFLAQELMYWFDDKMASGKACLTHQEKLVGAEVQERVQDLTRAYHLEEVVVRKLLAQYGSRAKKILHYIATHPLSSQWICPCQQVSMAELRYLIEQENCVRLSSLLQRIGLVGLLAHPAACFIRVVQFLAVEFNWNAKQTQEQIKHLLQELWSVSLTLVHEANVPQLLEQRRLLVNELGIKIYG